MEASKNKINVTRYKSIFGSVTSSRINSSAQSLTGGLAQL